MDFGRSTNWISVVLGVVLAIGVTVTASAQTPPGAATGELYTPAKDAKDLKAVLFNWMWHMGMLKGTDERDMVGTLEYQGKGTIQVDGQPCTLSKLRASTNYQTYTQRIQYTCTRGAQKVSNIEVVSGFYAWNEDVVGAEIGATKAALAGTTETWWLGANPSTLFADGLDKVGQTSVKWEAAKPVVTFPIPGVPGATGTATLDAKYMTEKVVVTNGSATTEFTYSGYKNTNNQLNKIERFNAGKMTEKK